MIKHWTCIVHFVALWLVLYMPRSPNQPHDCFRDVVACHFRGRSDDPATEGGWFFIQIALNLIKLTSPCYNETTHESKQAQWCKASEMKPNLVDQTYELLKWLCKYRKLCSTTATSSPGNITSCCRPRSVLKSSQEEFEGWWLASIIWSAWSD